MKKFLIFALVLVLVSALLMVVGFVFLIPFAAA